MSEHYVVYCSTLRTAATANVFHSPAIRIVTNWHDFIAIAPLMHAAGIVIEELGEVQARDIAKLRSDQPMLPLVLVFDALPRDLLTINRLPSLDSIISSREIRTLPIALQTAGDRSVLGEARAIIRRASHISSELQATLYRACLANIAVRTLHELASLLGGSEYEVKKLWRDNFSTSVPRNFIDWSLTAYAHTHWRYKASATSLAATLGVDRHTLVTAVRRSYGSDLKVLRVEGRAVILGRLCVILEMDRPA